MLKLEITYILSYIILEIISLILYKQNVIISVKLVPAQLFSSKHHLKYHLEIQKGFEII